MTSTTTTPNEPGAPIGGEGERAPAAAVAVAALAVVMYLLIAAGEIVGAAVTASGALIAGLATATVSPRPAVARAGAGLAAVSLGLVALTTAPEVDPVLRLGIVALALAPIAFLRSPSGPTWWDRPSGGWILVASTLALGVSFGAASGSVDRSVDVSALSGPALLGGISAVALAAATEEIVLRGALLDALGCDWTAVVGVAVVSGVIAGSVVGGGDAIGIAVLMALAWGALRRLSGSLWLPVLGHLVADVSIIWMWS
jgi:membrane protease YdiL (CAAX protease family)